MSNDAAEKSAKVAARIKAQKAAVWAAIHKSEPGLAILLKSATERFGPPAGVVLEVGGMTYRDGIEPIPGEMVLAIPSWQPGKGPGISRGKSASVSANPTGEKAA